MIDDAKKLAFQEKLREWRSALFESLPFAAFFVVLFFSIYALFGPADALIGIAFLFFSRTIVQEPGLSFGNYLHRVAWFFVMAMCATVAGLNPVGMVLISTLYLFFVTLVNSDDYLPRNFYWLCMGYLLLLIYPVPPEGIWLRAVSSLISIAFTTAFVWGMRAIYRKTGKIDVLQRDRSYVVRAFDDVGNQLLALAEMTDSGVAGEAETDVHPKKTFGIAQEYARMEYPTVFRQGGLLSGRQCYTFALLLCCEQIADMIHATAKHAEKVKPEESQYFTDLAAVFLDFGRGHITTVSQMVTRLEQFLASHELDISCHEESWSGVLEAMVRTLKDTRMSRDETTPFIKSLRYRALYLRDNVSLKNTQTRFALQLAIIVGFVGMTANVVLTECFDALFAIWVPITAFTVLNTYNDETLKSTFNNGIGTLVGILVFAFFVHFIPESFRMPIVVPLSYLIILINFSQAACVTAGTQMALIALYPYAELSTTVFSRLVLVVIAVTCVMMVVFVFMRTRRAATIHAKVAELERIDVRLASHIHHAAQRGHVDLWRAVQLLYYAHMDAWLLEEVAAGLGRRASLGKRRRIKRDAVLNQLRSDVDRVLGMNYKFVMDAEHAVMLLDPRRSDGTRDAAHGGRPDTTARIRHIDATTDRLDEKIHRLEDMRYLEEEGEADRHE